MSRHILPLVIDFCIHKCDPVASATSGFQLGSVLCDIRIVVIVVFVVLAEYRRCERVYEVKFRNVGVR